MVWLLFISEFVCQVKAYGKTKPFFLVLSVVKSLLNTWILNVVAYLEVSSKTCLFHSYIELNFMQ